MRVRFPEGFHWGAATAAYQIEGATRADGRGESIWDRFCRRPGAVKNGDTGDTACDSYHRFADDVALLREMNLTSYRFSIAWPRLFPTGAPPLHSKGIEYYARLVEALLEAGIRPLPTLYHWDLPQRLEDRGGWSNRDTAGRFADYADTVARALGDRVDAWTLFNEPNVFTVLGYRLGIHAPGRRDPEGFWRAVHTVNLAQGEAFRAIKASRPNARLGGAFHLSPCEPATDDERDADAAERWHGLANALHLEPALAGRYPDVFDAGPPLDAMGFRDGDLERTRAPFDFLGLNVYARTLVRYAPVDPLAAGVRAAPVTRGGLGGSEGPRTDLGWEVWPRALADAVARVSREYPGVPIEITENGCAYADTPDTSGRVDDARRIDFHRDYLEALAGAIEAGADVRGYHAWSLLDNFEWAEGYGQRFGLAHVDFPTGARTLKASGHWYARVADTGGFDT